MFFFNIVSQFLLATIEFHYYYMNLSQQNLPIWYIYRILKKKKKTQLQKPQSLLYEHFNETTQRRSLATTKWKINIL